MSVEKDLRTYMLSRSAINSLIGTRMWSHKPPQDPTFPYVTYFRVSTPVRVRSQEGDSSLTTARIQYSSWGLTPDSVEALAEAIENEMKSFSGTAGSSTIYASIVENRGSLLDPESKYYHIPIDLMIQYNG